VRIETSRISVSLPLSESHERFGDFIAFIAYCLYLLFEVISFMSKIKLLWTIQCIEERNLLSAKGFFPQDQVIVSNLNFVILVYVIQWSPIFFVFCSALFMCSYGQLV